MTEERQQDWTIGETYTLPSKGLIYNQQGAADVTLRAMTSRDEMKRQNPTKDTYKMLANLIKDCMVDKNYPVDPYDMAMGDYEFLLHKLRSLSYGDEYKTSVFCPECEKYVEVTAHLNDLQPIEYDEKQIRECSQITLPNSNHVVSIRFTTPRIKDNVTAKVKELTRKFPNSEKAFDELVFLEEIIESVDGMQYDQFKLETFINNLSARDFRKICNASEKLDSLVGIDNRLIVDCPFCGGEVQATFRYGPEFFRPHTI